MTPRGRLHADPPPPQLGCYLDSCGCALRVSVERTVHLWGKVNDLDNKPTRRSVAIIIALMALLAIALTVFGVWATSETVNKVHFGMPAPTTSTSTSR